MSTFFWIGKCRNHILKAKCRCRYFASRWTWDQGHHREHHFYFLPRLLFSIGGMDNFILPSTTNEMISISTSQTFCQWVVIFHLRWPKCVFNFQLIRYTWAWTSYECAILSTSRLSTKLLKQEYLVERLKSSFRKFYGRYWDLIQQYEVSLSPWPLTSSDFSTDQTFHQFHDLDTELELLRIMSGFHGAFATFVACQQGTLTLPNTWFHLPFFGTCLCSYCWNQIARTCPVFTRRFTLNTPWYFLDLLCNDLECSGFIVSFKMFNTFKASAHSFKRLLHGF